MAVFVPFHCFALDLGKGVHDFSNDTLKIYLTNEAPELSDTVYGNPADLPTEGGYTAGGISMGVNTWSQVNGLASLVPGEGTLLYTATTGFGPFRYAVLYNDSAQDKNLIAYWDNGASISIAAGGSFSVVNAAAAITLRF